MHVFVHPVTVTNQGQARFHAAVGWMACQAVWDTRHVLLWCLWPPACNVTGSRPRTLKCGLGPDGLSGVFVGAVVLVDVCMGLFVCCLCIVHFTSVYGMPCVRLGGPACQCHWPRPSALRRLQAGWFVRRHSGRFQVGRVSLLIICCLVAAAAAAACNVGCCRCPYTVRPWLAGHSAPPQAQPPGGGDVV